METGHRETTFADWGWTIAGLAFGAFGGLIAGTMAVLLYQGFWVLILLASPLLLIQFLFEWGIGALVRGWRRWRGYPPKPDPVPRHRRTDLPWLRRYGFPIGFCLGAIYALVVNPPF